MKMIKAIIREERVPFVKKALTDKNIYGMTLLPAMGRGSQGGIHLQFRGGILNIDMLPKVMMEVIIPDDLEEMVIHQILSSAKTGREGDGKIFIIPVNESHRIRTGEVEV